MIQLIPLVILLPALGALVNAFYPRKAVARIVGPGVIGLAFLVALGVLITLLGLPADQRSVGAGARSSLRRRSRTRFESRLRPRAKAEPQKR